MSENYFAEDKNLFIFERAETRALSSRVATGMISKLYSDTF